MVAASMSTLAQNDERIRIDNQDDRPHAGTFNEEHGKLAIAFDLVGGADRGDGLRQAQERIMSRCTCDRISIASCGGASARQRSSATQHWPALNACTSFLVGN